MPYSIHSALNAPWEAVISNIKTEISVGIYEHEKAPQTILVSATIRGHYPAYPKDISECTNYEMLQSLTESWKTRDQVALLETLAMECFEEIFTKCPHAQEATVSIMKPDIFADTEAVG